MTASAGPSAPLQRAAHAAALRGPVAADRSTAHDRAARRRFAAAALVVVALALGVRLALFIGYQGHDDRTYIAYAWLFAQGGDLAARGLVDPWVGRMGAWLPMALSIRLFGGGEPALVAYSLATSLGGLLLLLAFARRCFDARTALVAGLLLALLPIDVVYSTRAFADQAVGFWCVAALLAYWLAVTSNTARWGLGAGLAFGVAYLTKETALLMALPFALIAWQQRAPVGRALGFGVLGFAVVLAVEWCFWYAATGDPLYRWHSTLAVRADYVLSAPPARSWFDWIPSPIPSEVFRSDNTLVDAAAMAMTNEEWGFLHYVAMPVAVVALFRGPPVARALATFLLSMLLLLLFLPLHFPHYTLGRDPRFFTCLGIPAVLLIAQWSTRLAPFWRRAVPAFLLLSWLPCLYVGHLSSDMSTERQLARFVAERPEQRFWMSNVAACDVIVLSGFTPRLDLGILAVRAGRVVDAPGLALSNPMRALRDGLPVAERLAQTAGQWAVLPAGVQPAPGWVAERDFQPRPDALALALRSALSPWLRPSLVDKIAPSHGRVLRLYRT